MDFRKHLINKNSSVKEALNRLNEISTNAIVFLIDDDDKLVGSLTDGDLRRGFLKGFGIDTPLTNFIQSNPKFINSDGFDLREINKLKEKNFSVFPVLNGRGQIINILDFKNKKSYIPVDALIMAGGRGERLRPLTDEKPKPLLLVGNRPIIEHNIERLSNYGIDNIWLSVRYLGEQLIQYFGDGSQRNMKIKYVHEDYPLGTAGALGKVKDFIHEYVLMMNSDLLTNIDFEDFFFFFQENEADLIVACIPYEVKVPYAVMETDGIFIKGFCEKPTYTHYSNAGIYLLKKSIIDFVPKDTFFNATDLIEKLIKEGKKVLAYPLLGYWLDIGKPEDYKKAQFDINKVKF